jgi:hypothetical protein
VPQAMNPSNTAIAAAVVGVLALEGVHVPIAQRAERERVPCTDVEMLAGCRPSPHPPERNEHESPRASHVLACGATPSGWRRGSGGAVRGRTDKQDGGQVFEPNRKYTHCIFCGAGGTTKEHIFGKTLARELGIQEHWRVLLPDGSTKQGPSPFLNLAPTVLCKNCNTVRLRPDNEAAMPHILRLCKGEAFALDNSARSHLLRYFQRVAFIVDVCTSTEQIDDDRRQRKEHQDNAEFRTAEAFFSQEERAGWLDGKFNGSLYVSLGYHTGKLGANPECNAGHLRLRAECSDGRKIDGPTLKRFSVVIRHLAVTIDIGPTPTFIPPPWLITPAMVPLQVLDAWPRQPELTVGDYLRVAILPKKP